MVLAHPVGPLYENIRELIMDLNLYVLLLLLLPLEWAISKHFFLQITQKLQHF